MLHYKAIYRKDIEDFPDQEPVGLIISGQGYREHMIWDHRAQSWRYDPETAGYILGREDYDFRRRLLELPGWEQFTAPSSAGSRKATSAASAAALPHRFRVSGVVHLKLHV